MLKLTKWISATVASALVAASFSVTTPASAQETKTIADETIYDLLVDRYFNATAENDYNADPKDNTQFAGGDFRGLIDKFSLIQDLGYSIVSIGSIFKTEKYDGSMATSYHDLEPHFGTAEELETVIDTYSQSNVKVMVDFPLSNVSENHEWAQDPAKAEWIAGSSDGKVQWDLQNEEVQQALLDAVVDFVSTYKFGGVRLTNLGNADTEFLNELISAIKEVNENLYVISNEQSDANFDANYFSETTEAFRNVYKNVDQDSSNLLAHIEPYAKGDQAPTQLMLDNLLTDRFTLTNEAFPPTRTRLGIVATLLLPGVPVTQYGTELIMNGEAGPKAHQLYNFKTDEEMIDFIGDIQTLRSQSETLRNGEYKLLKNENGFLAFERFSDQERWIVVINNTGKTTRFDISEEEIGAGKELLAMLDSDTIRVNNEGNYPIILDREIVEIFQVKDEKGINKGYLAALAVVYVLFIGFIIAIIKRGKRKRTKEQ
ncbi:alpha-amylase family glycosyl hydrolase [Ureibacillus aquaedulcis]|uniref:Alpha-amylase family glycosyl hydrolase n=1 Tax=Ureibacillus aquaedulcis TaxID=3058421 RepID=A0ABT8GLJ1_9BACL|nr:alpha-amylase family glycosyl hydrolase [Ureibacillus sp. BA0131]MDN4492275.1 alpha-amylase family glycosyl hydrolase [Ureibacillus sp. BA0131]